MFDAKFLDTNSWCYGRFENRQETTGFFPWKPWCHRPNIIRQSFEELPSGLVDPAQALSAARTEHGGATPVMFVGGTLR